MIYINVFTTTLHFSTRREALCYEKPKPTTEKRLNKGQSINKIKLIINSIIYLNIVKLFTNAIKVLFVLVPMGRKLF